MELNEDGLIPGQDVDFETIMRVKREQEKKQPVQNVEEETKEEAPKPRRSRKDAAA